jgi:hypothetical protein
MVGALRSASPPAMMALESQIFRIISFARFSRKLNYQHFSAEKTVMVRIQGVEYVCVHRRRIF